MPARGSALHREARNFASFPAVQRGPAKPLTMAGDRLPGRDALTALADAGLIGHLLDDWRVEGGKPAVGPWRREYARFHPGQDPWAVCLYQANDGSLVRIEALLSAERASVVQGKTGPLRIAEFPDDAELPGLGEVMSMLESVQVVRYRPGQRCTLRGFAAGGERFVQLIPGGERVYNEALSLWAAYREGSLSLAVPEPYGWHAPTRSFWQGVVPGRAVLPELLGPDGERFAHRIGAAMGEVAASKLVPALGTPATEHLGHTVRSIARAELALPALAPRFAQVQTELERRHNLLPQRAGLPVHGAPNLRRWLMQGARLGLVSFDRFALGDPEFDLATLVAELETERSMVRQLSAMEAALSAGFEASGLRLDPARSNLYRIHKRLFTMVRTAWATRPDAALRAEYHLRTVEVMLERD